MTESLPELVSCMADKIYGVRCNRQPVEGTKYCLEHQDWERLAPVRNARYAKAMGRLNEAYQSSRMDPGLVDMREPLAAIDALIQRTLQRLSDLDTMDFRKKARELLQNYMGQWYAENKANGTGQEIPKALAKLQEHLRVGCEEDKLHQRALDSLDKFTRRLSDFWTIKLARRNSVNATDTVAGYKRFVDIVRSEVSPDQFSRIVERIEIEIFSDPDNQSLNFERARFVDVDG